MSRADRGTDGWSLRAQDGRTRISGMERRPLLGVKAGLDAPPGGCYGLEGRVRAGGGLNPRVKRSSCSWIDCQITTAASWIGTWT
jgi:hypothetical protein